MKKNRFLPILSAVLFVLQLAATALLLTGILRLDVLPGKYMTLVVCGLTLPLILTGLLCFLPAKKPSGGKGRRIIACVLAVVFTAGCVLGFIPVHRVHDTMQTITNPDNHTQEGPTRLVFVLNDDPAQSLEDAKMYVFGTVSGYDTQNTENALKAITEHLGQTVEIAAYGSVYEMVDALYNGGCQAIILNGGYVSILEDTEGYDDFSRKTRILHEVILPEPEPEAPTVQQPTEPSQEPSEPSQPVVQEQPEMIDPFIMYVSGSDTRSATLKTGNSDVNILVVVNPQTKQVLLVNTPRDYYIPNPAGYGELDKLTHCGMYGIKYSVRALEDLYGIQVDYYSQLNFTGFETLVDAVGGVTVESPVTFTSGDVTIYKGENDLNGKEALAFARERYQMPGGDSGRGQNQMKVIKAIIAKATNGTTIITNYAQILDSLEGMFVTSMEMSQISALVKMQLSDMAQWNIQTYGVVGANGREITYSIPGYYASVMYKDEGRVAYGTELINMVLSGEILTEEDVKYPGQ